MWVYFLDPGKLTNYKIQWFNCDRKNIQYKNKTGRIPETIRSLIPERTGFSNSYNLHAERINAEKTAVLSQRTKQNLLGNKMKNSDNSIHFSCRTSTHTKDNPLFHAMKTSYPTTKSQPRLNELTSIFF